MAWILLTRIRRTAGLCLTKSRARLVRDSQIGLASGELMSHPSPNIPGFARGTRSVENLDAANVNPAVGFPFKLSPRDKVATAGSCFAQHIARRLKNDGFNY